MSWIARVIIGITVVVFIGLISIFCGMLLSIPFFQYLDCLQGVETCWNDEVSMLQHITWIFIKKNKQMMELGLDLRTLFQLSLSVSSRA